MFADDFGVQQGAFTVGWLRIRAEEIGDARGTGAAHVGPAFRAAVDFVLIPDIAIGAGGFFEEIVGGIVAGTVDLDAAAGHHGIGQGTLGGDLSDRAVALEARVVAPSAMGIRRAFWIGSGVSFLGLWIDLCHIEILGGCQKVMDFLQLWQHPRLFGREVVLAEHERRAHVTPIG